MAHHCHATGCRTTTKPELFMCRGHWFQVPFVMRQRIWATYRPGQCDDMNPSREYCIAAKAAVVAVARAEGLEPDTNLYDGFLRRV